MQSKGKRNKYEVSCVAWMDLLGYGSMLAESSFSPSDSKTEQAIQRLRVFHRITAKHAHKNFPVMQINDGVAYFKDLSYKSNSVTADFLHRSINIFEMVNKEEKSKGFPGARMVISVGPRARISRPRYSSAHLRSIFDRLAAGALSPRGAIEEAFRSPPIAGFVPQLQANFAFTRAYLVDEAGSKSGFGGSKCYIDLTLFNNGAPNWLSFSRTKTYKNKGIDIELGQYQSVDWKNAGKHSFAGISELSLIAQRLGMGTEANIF